MAAGVFGYLGYDMVRQMERLPAPTPTRSACPTRILMRPTVMVVFDAVKDEITVVTPVRPRRRRHRRAGLRGGVRAPRRPSSPPLDGPLPHTPARSPRAELPPATPTSNTTPERATSTWSRGRRSTSRAGDIFQVVLSQRFAAPFALPPFALYRALRRVNPSPFLFYLDFGDFALVGSSPEILVRVRDGEVTIRPIAGTAPARRDAGGGPGARPTSCSPTPRSAPST